LYIKSEASSRTSDKIGGSRYSTLDVLIHSKVKLLASFVWIEEKVASTHPRKHVYFKKL
jgi:hypothetical protein